MLVNIIQFLTMDLLDLESMKSVASCNKYCELQKSMNHQIFKRRFCSLDMQGAFLFERCVKPAQSGVARWGA